MIKLTHEQFCEQWITGKYYTRMASRLEYNISDFATAVGEYTKQQFQSSFERGGFCGGPKWAPRTSKWGKKFKHPVLRDTGALERGIKDTGTRNSKAQGRSRSFHRNIFIRSAHYGIYTTEQSIYQRGKRGRKRGLYKNYAAVHNTDPKYGLYTVNQYSSRRPVHRQFIGFSPTIDAHVNSHFIKMIFEGFPQ